MNLQRGKLIAYDYDKFKYFYFAVSKELEDFALENINICATIN